MTFSRSCILFFLFGLLQMIPLQAQTFTMIKSIGNSTNYPQNLTEFKGVLYFQNYDDVNGMELWKSDGTNSGTKLVKDIASGKRGSNPAYFTEYNNALYFVADDSIHGRELWKTDGTALGTVLIKDIFTGLGNGCLVSNNQSIIVFNNELYFAGNDDSNDMELWKTNGTEAGTSFVKRFITGGSNYGPENMVVYNGSIIFFADYRLWKSDGTTAGTTVLKNADGYPFFPFDIKIANNLVYMRAQSAYSGKNHYDVWVTDGTPSGTKLLKTINADGNSFATNFKTLGNIVLFTADDGIHGNELWRTDGTEAGTFMVKDIYSGTKSSCDFTDDFKVAGGYLYFAAKDSLHGMELWRSDGTESGTSLVSDLLPGQPSSGIRNLLPINNTLYFIGNDNVSGFEIHKSNSLNNNTSLLYDLKPGNNFYSISNMIYANGYVYFFTLDNQISQLWKLDLSGPPSIINSLIRNQISSPMSIYPNPSSGSFRIHGEILSVRMTDVLGKSEKHVIHDNSFTTLLKGVLQVEINARNGKTFYQKIVVE